MNWTYRGEKETSSVNIQDEGFVAEVDEIDDDDENEDEMLNMLNDAFPNLRSDPRDEGLGTNGRDSCEVEPPNFSSLFFEARKELYSRCTKFSVLIFLVMSCHINVLNKWCNKSIDMLFKLLWDAMPEGIIILESYYAAKQMMQNLGIGYDTIDVCKNDCVLYYKEYKDLKEFPVYKHKRNKNAGDKGKNVPHKKMRFFPLAPRLQRLFMLRHTSPVIRWHKEERVEEGLLRHPVDREAWKDFDQ